MSRQMNRRRFLQQEYFGGSGVLGGEPDALGVGEIGE